MLYLTDNLSAKAFDAIKKYNLEEALNEKIYTISDTPLSYRQANTLDTDNLLDNKRKNSKGWRKFSFKELVYILVVFELKRFGIKHEQLKQLWQSFFKSPEKPLEPSTEPNEAESTLAIACVFGGVETALCVDSDGNINYYDPSHSIMFSQNTKPLIKISLNQAVKDVIKEGIPITGSLEQLIFDYKISPYSKKEDELLKIIRDKQYSSIRVKKKDGEISIVYAEKQNSEGEIGLKELETLIKAKDYQDVQLIKRDGKIVNYKIEETFKL